MALIHENRFMSEFIKDKNIFKQAVQVVLDANKDQAEKVVTRIRMSSMGLNII